LGAQNVWQALKRVVGRYFHE